MIQEGPTDLEKCDCALGAFHRKEGIPEGYWVESPAWRVEYVNALFLHEYLSCDPHLHLPLHPVRIQNDGYGGKNRIRRSVPDRVKRRLQLFERWCRYSHNVSVGNESSTIVAWIQRKMLCCGHMACKVMVLHAVAASDHRRKDGDFTSIPIKEGSGGVLTSFALDYFRMAHAEEVASGESRK